jgi:hypothetical protein
MHSQRTFLRIAAVCSFLSVITTIGIHLGFTFDTPTFESKVALVQNAEYLLGRWWIITHCLLVLVASWGVYAVQRQYAPAWSGLGLLFFYCFCAHRDCTPDGGSHLFERTAKSLCRTCR